MAAGPEFPAFLQLKAAPSNDARNAFISDIDSILATSHRKLGDFEKRAQATLDAALRVPRNAAGALDLDASGTAAAAAAQQARAVAAREYAQAIGMVAREEGQNSLAMRQSLVAAQELAAAEERRAAELAQTAQIMGAVQERLNRQASATEAVTGAMNRQRAANDNVIAGAGAQRAAFGMLGQQMQDATVQLQMGTSALTVFSQQAPQAAFALSGLAGSADKTKAAIGSAAAFMAGPWGAAIFAATAVLGPFIARLFDTSTAADQVKFATGAMGDAQSILGGVLDMTSGKINNQSAALRALAQAQLLVAKVQAQTRAADARRGVQDIQTRGLQISGGLGGGFSASRRPRDARDTISEQVLAGTLDGTTAVQRLENLRAAGLLTDEQFAAAATSVANLGVELENLKVFDQADKLLNGTGGRELLKPASGGKKGGGKKAGASDAEKAAKELADQAEAVRRISTEQARQIELGQLMAAGREEEADALALQHRLMDAIGVTQRDQLATALAKRGVTESEYDALLENLSIIRATDKAAQAAAERRRASDAEAERRIARQLESVNALRGNIVTTISELSTRGFGAAGGFFARLQDQFRQDLAESLTENIFGEAFRSMEQTLRDSKGAEASSALTAAQALNTLARAADKAAVAQAGAGSAVEAQFDAEFGSKAANDNSAAITVIAQRLQDFSDPRRLYAMLFEKLGATIFGPDKAKKFGEAVAGALQGAAYGQIGGGLIGARSTEGKIGSSIGGMLGDKVGEKLFKKLGDFAGPLGSLIGGALGGLFGGLFKKTTSGAVSLGVNQFGAAGISNTIGNSAAIQKEATGFGGAVSGSLNRIAEALGATVGDFSVAIGKRSSGWIKVSASGNAQATTGKKVTSDIIYNGKDEAEAIRAALLNAIQDGAIKGIREGAQRLLKAGSDIEAQLQKAMDFQSVFDRLKAYKDPVGAALDTLNREFEKLKRTFAEAGASTAEYAELEELYGIERAKAIKEAAQRVTGSLQSLFDDLMIGDTGLSLRDRRANAKAAYDPLAARVAAGDSSAYDDYVKAAQALLDIERQISGSTQAYFDRRDEIARLTKTQIDAQQARMDAATNSDSPFSNSSANGDNQGVIEALDRLGNSLLDGLLSGLGGRLDAVNENLGALILAGTGGRDATLPALGSGQYW